MPTWYCFPVPADAGSVLRRVPSPMDSLSRGQAVTVMPAGVVLEVAMRTTRAAVLLMTLMPLGGPMEPEIPLPSMLYLFRVGYVSCLPFSRRDT